VTSTAAQLSADQPIVQLIETRSPLAQLLHALNQPLTGLQCAMEVAVATPRTAEHYAKVLREGLELTERMRALVETIRELADLDEEREKEKEKNEPPQTIELGALLRETVDDLQPVAEAKNIRVTLNCLQACSVRLNVTRRRMVSTVFRFLESALSLAAPQNGLFIEALNEATEVWVRVRWQGERPAAAFSRPELGLMVSQAVFERSGARWERERSETFETIIVRLPIIPDSRTHS